MDWRSQIQEYPLVIGKALRRPMAGRVAWVLVTIQALLYPFSLYLGTASGDRLPANLQFGWWGALSPLLGMGFGIVGALIVRRHPGHGVGLLAAAGGFFLSLSAFAGAYAAYSLTHAHVLPAGGLAEWLRGWIWYPATSLTFIVLPAVFPDGRLLSPRWKWFAIAVAAGISAQLLWVSLSQLMFGFQNVDGPWEEAGWLFNALTSLAGLLWILPLFLAVVAVLLRFRKARGLERQQLKWFLAAVAVQALFWAGSFSVSLATHLSPYQNPFFEILIPLSLLAIPLAIGIAILRHRLYDIDIVISRGLVYAGLATFITLAYLLVVVAVGFAVGTGGRPNVPLSILAMAIVVLLIQPVRVRLQRLANRLVYGVPTDPYEVLAELSRTTGAGDVDQALAHIAQAFARGMSSPRARVTLLLPGAPARTATWPPGASGNFGRTFFVTDGGETVGEIEADSSGDEGLNEALAGQAGLALRTLRLSSELATRLIELEAKADELTASRTRLVQAQESERRRLERDLHDGIQQDLVVLIAKARLARNQLGRDPASAAETLAELQSSAQHAVADLRSLARGIHPAVLSSRGLVEAIDSMAARMPVGVHVDVDPRVRAVRFPPEIEGAAYFVVAEGLANVLKHSGASEATVTISAIDSSLRLAIADNGNGFDAAAVKESGLRGVRDRVSALGGHVEVTGSGSGARLEVSLPANPLSAV